MIVIQVFIRKNRLNTASNWSLYRSGQNRTEHNIIVIGLKSIYKGLLPKQHIKYKTKTLLTTIKLHIYMFETHDSLMTFSMRRWYILNMI